MIMEDKIDSEITCLIEIENNLSEADAQAIEKGISFVTLEDQNRDFIGDKNVKFILKPDDSGQTEVREVGPGESSHFEVLIIGGKNGTSPRFLYNENLCRICLLNKADLIQLFRDAVFGSTGMIENQRGPSASNKFNIIAAINTFLDVKIEYNDGLPNKICIECLDSILNFSLFRKRIGIGQGKLINFLKQTEKSSLAMIPSLGEINMNNTQILKHTELIIKAQEMMEHSQYSHLVKRNLSNATWEKILIEIGAMVGFKSGKLKMMEKYCVDSPYVKGFLCYTCNIIIHGDKNNFMQHYIDVHGISSEDIQFPCDICGESFFNHDPSGLKQDYAAHWTRHFFFFKCLECEKKFPSLKGLWVHSKSAHTQGNRIFNCDICGKSFGKKTHLTSHVKTHLNAEERKKELNYCHICGKGLCGSLSSHMILHSDKYLKCDICFKTFKRKEVLITHRDTVHYNIKKFKCEICGEMLRSHSAKAVHVSRHKGEKPHSCSVCSKKYYSATALKSHMVKHSDMPEFSCEICAKKFKRKVYLNEHFKVHSGEKPHQCGKCGKWFRMKSNLFKHFKVHKRKEGISEAAEAAAAVDTDIQLAIGDEIQLQ